MQTKCPHCNKECDYPDDLRNHPVDCPWCDKPFLARQVMGAKISDDFVEQLKNPASYVPNIGPGKPGTLYCGLGVVAILLGLFGLVESFVFFISGLSAALTLFAIGIALNQLERIAYHTERLRNEIKQANQSQKKVTNK